MSVQGSSDGIRGNDCSKIRAGVPNFKSVSINATTEKGTGEGKRGDLKEPRGDPKVNDRKHSIRGGG